MKKGQGFLLVYSIVTESTFREIPDIIDQIYRIKDSDAVPIPLDLSLSFPGSIGIMWKQSGSRRRSSSAKRWRGKTC
jgi:hypothetical protein